MANYTPAFETDGQLGGIGPTTVFTPDPASGYDNPPLGQGTKRIGTDNSEWLFVLAVTAINYGDCVHVDQNANASQMTTAFAAAGTGLVAFASVAAIPAGSYGFVALVGDSLNITVANGTAAGASLYTTAVPGVLSSTATGQSQIYGVKTVTANASGAAAQEPAIATAPRTVN